MSIKLTSFSDGSDLDTLLVCHESQDGEDDEACEDGGGAVEHGHNDGVAVTVVGELIETGHGNQPTRTRAQGVEDLGGGIAPHLGCYVIKIITIIIIIIIKLNITTII